MSTVIDITDIVSKAESTFVVAAENYIIAQVLAIPGIGPVTAFFIKIFFGWFLNWLLGVIAAWEVMQAFFLNTAIRKASQAQDYVDAVNAKDSLGPGATDAEYSAAEQLEISAFNSFVCLAN